MNFVSEVMRFADRNFYQVAPAIYYNYTFDRVFFFFQDWWCSTSFSMFYRKWNAVVHDWIHAYMFNDVKAVSACTYISKCYNYNIVTVFCPSFDVCVFCFLSLSSCLAEVEWWLFARQSLSLRLSTSTSCPWLLGLPHLCSSLSLLCWEVRVVIITLL